LNTNTNIDMNGLTRLEQEMAVQECAMCSKEVTDLICPHCRKPLCEKHGTTATGYTPGQDCRAPALTVLDIIELDKQEYTKQMSRLTAKFGTVRR
jgi:hypothetical protein